MTYKISGRLKKFGGELLSELDKTIYRPTAMLWTDSLKPGKWVLVIGTMIARVPENTILEDFNKKQDKMAKDIKRLIMESNLEDPKFDFATLSPKHAFLMRLGSIVNTEVNAVNEIEINNFTVDDVDVGNNYIYRLFTQ